MNLLVIFFNHHVCPVLNSDVAKETKKEKAGPTVVPLIKPEPKKVPSELKCPMCNNLLTDAVLIPCCGTSYCDDCKSTDHL